jgi:hypothetical protein
MAETELLGNITPRILLPKLPAFTPDNTLGFECIDFARNRLGVTPMPHQELILKAGLLLNPDGSFRFRTIVIIMGRQSGKTRTLQILTLWRLFRDDARLVLTTSAQRTTAVECFRGACELAEAARLPVLSVRWANGQESLTTDTGGRYLVAANNRRAGRGLSADLVTLDELREHRDWLAWNSVSKTITARTRGQRWCFSSGAEADSIVLRTLRDRALTGGDTSDILLMEWSADPAAALDDITGWQAANPALGRTVPLSALRDDLATDPPATFRNEVLAQQVETRDGAVDPQAWSGNLDLGTLDQHRSRVALGFDVNGQYASLVAAAQINATGTVRVEGVRQWSDVAQAVRELPELIARIKPRSFAWIPTGPSARIKTDLSALPFNTEVTGSTISACCQEFAEMVRAGKLLHNGDTLLASSVLGARKLTVGNGWIFDRATSSAAAYSAAQATHQARQIKYPANGMKLRLVTV